jgi:hypothetical protein
LSLSNNISQEQNKENRHWVSFNKRKAIEKARKLADDQHKKVVELMKVLQSF